MTGWAWLSWDPVSSKLEVDKTIGAGNPMTDGKKPLLTMDVWEHAYYLGSSHPCFGPWAATIPLLRDQKKKP